MLTSFIIWRKQLIPSPNKPFKTNGRYVPEPSVTRPASLTSSFSPCSPCTATPALGCRGPQTPANTSAIQGNTNAKYLHCTANEELSGSVSQVEVSGLENITTSPHHHHGDAHAISRPLHDLQVRLAKNPSPPVFEVPVELRHTKHCLGEHCQETHRLNKGTDVDQEEHEDGANQGNHHDELNITMKIQLQVPLQSNTWGSLSTARRTEGPSQ